MFCTLMRAAEAFSGVRVLNYVALDNHFHALIQVPRAPAALSEAELLDRVEALYGKDGRRAREELWATYREQEHGELVLEDQARLKARMHDVSAFMKTLKQRYTQWHNRKFGRTGTLWEQRFKSVLVEGSEGALRTMCAYIDLNAVRAKIVSDPKDYRWCGYAAALSGVQRAREGIAQALGGFAHGADWKTIAVKYRLFLYASGECGALDENGRPEKPGFSPEQAGEVLAKGGKLTVFELLHCRVRYFTDGAVLGSREFVEDAFERYRQFFGLKRKTGARPMRCCEAPLCTMRALRLEPVSVPASG